MRKVFGAIFMLLAVVMLAGAGLLIYENNAVETQAGESAEQIMFTLTHEMHTHDAAAINPDISAAPEITVEPQASLDPEMNLIPEMMAAPQASVSPVAASSPETKAEAERPEMPVKEIDGNAYIGYLELPTIGIELPVMSDWSYPQLKIAPCRYWGSAYDDTLVIMAHNYDRHFGRIGSMEPGTPVQFVDVDGNIYKYVVAKQEILQKQDVDKMISREWDLTLFSCTYGGRNRVTVRLERVLAY